MSEKPRIGFVGLGLMGQACTARLVECGYSVTGYDIDAEKVSAAAAHGVTGATSPAAVAAASDIILICVIDTAAVEAVLFGEDGVAGSDVAGKAVIDLSTTVVEKARAFAMRLRDQSGCGLVDAPVSGGPPAARAGTLAVMAGGEDADIAQIAPLMADVAATFTHFGPAGSGQVAKMVNQVLVLNNFAVLAEALALAEAGGIDAAKIPDALAPGHAGSNLLKAMFPRMIARDFEPAGYARQVLKDLDMVQDLAKSLKSPTPISSQTASLYRILISKGYGELDATSVLKLLDPAESV